MNYASLHDTWHDDQVGAVYFYYATTKKLYYGNEHRRMATHWAIVITVRHFYDGHVYSAVYPATEAKTIASWAFYSRLVKTFNPSIALQNIGIIEIGADEKWISN